MCILCMCILVHIWYLELEYYLCLTCFQAFEMWTASIH